MKRLPFRRRIISRLECQCRAGRLAAATATVDVLQNYGKAVMNGQDYNSGDAVKDFMSGFISDLAGGSFSDVVNRFGTCNVAKGLQKLGFDQKRIEETFEKAGIKLCFTKGTLVLTVDGYKAIENIAIGDSVWAYSDTLGLTKKQKVIQVFRNETDKYFVIKFGGRKIEATLEHPFFVENKWVTAQDLKVGDKLTTFDKKQVTVESIEFVHKNAPVYVYNFTVENYHTYYVSAGNVLVHNGEPCKASTLPDWKGPVDYSDIADPKSVKVGGNFTAKQKQLAREKNIRENGGHLRSDIDGTVLEKAEKSKRGVTPSPNEVQHDHKQSKKARGDNSSGNMQITSRKQNRDKGA